MATSQVEAEVKDTQWVRQGGNDDNEQLKIAVGHSNN